MSTLKNSIFDWSSYPKTQYLHVPITNPSKKRGTHVNLAYHVYGTKYISTESKYPPLIFVQGWTGVKEDWLKLPVLLSKTRLVIALDNRGIGESIISYPDNVKNHKRIPSLTIKDMADDVIALVRHIFTLCDNKYKCTDMCGLSMGGMITQTVLLHYGSLINKAILLSTTPGGGTHCPYILKDRGFIIANNKLAKAKTKQEILELFREVYKNLLRKDFNDPILVNKLINLSMKTRRPYRVIMGQMNAILKFNVKDKLKSIKNSVLVIHGTFDKVLDYRNGVYMSERIPGCKAKIIEDEGHCIQYNYIGMLILYNEMINFYGGNIGPVSML